MKIIYSVLIILITCIIISCNNSSSDDGPTGYRDPGLTPKDVSTNKSFNNIAVGCVNRSGQTCKAVIYQGTPYVGIAIDDDSNFKLKIYWEGTINTPMPITSNQYTIKVISSGIEYSTTSDPLNVTITPHVSDDKLLTIQFNSPINLGGVTINNGATINAFKY